MFSKPCNLLLILFLFSFSFVKASNALNTGPNPDVGALLKQIEKLKSHHSALYIAAHPDDENQAVLAWLANHKLARTAYLSLTRGSGGQNLIGQEMGPLLGVLRTQELLAARKVDGAQQFFTRAVDFGYSKTSGETLDLWQEELLLYDMVYTIRKFRPDVLITRFPPDARAGHGHHTTSAILAQKAFEISGDPNVFPDQLKDTKPWQVKRLLWNASAWWDKELPEKAKNSDRYIGLDVGAYDPVLGQSYTEIAAEARSKHRCQGFGASKRRGKRIEYLKLQRGEALQGTLLDDVSISWEDIPGGSIILPLIEHLANNFNPLKPSSSVKELLTIRRALHKLDQENYYIRQKIKELDRLLLDCAGVWAEATADDYEKSIEDTVQIKAQFVFRSESDVRLISVLLGDQNQASQLEETAPNKLVQKNFKLAIDESLPNLNPYYLNAPFDKLYTVTNKNNIGRAENKAALMARFTISIEGDMISFDRPVRYKWTDPAIGELYRAFGRVPSVDFTLDQNVHILPLKEWHKVRVSLTANKENVNGTIVPEIPEGWSLRPSSKQFLLKNKGDVAILDFELLPPDTESTGSISFVAHVKNEMINVQRHSISYPHIPPQEVFLPAEAKLVYVPINTPERKIAYIPGAGDKIPETLLNLGYEVDIIQPEALLGSNLDQYQTIVTGIRAYNVHKELNFAYQHLMDYVAKGGNLMVQYNTSRLGDTRIAPYPMTITRDRITAEDAPTLFIAQSDALFSYPNKITENDFEGWVQERGLYFAKSDDPKYKQPISWTENGDTLSGGLLIARHGKGNFIYTGISFFRQLPAGVPGACKLFVNLINYDAKP